MRGSLRTGRWIAVLAVPVAVLAVVLATRRPPLASTDRFVAIISHDVDVSYSPLTSPHDAVARSDLIVVGTLSDVVDRMKVEFPDPMETARSARDYTTFVVKVDKVLSGNAALVSDGRVYVEVLRNNAVTPRELALLNPHGKIVLVLADISTWTPNPSTRVVKPPAVPAEAPIFAPYTDGLWLQAPADRQMRGIHATLAELAPGWGGVRTVDGFVAAIEKAAGERVKTR